MPVRKGNDDRNIYHNKVTILIRDSIFPFHLHFHLFDGRIVPIYTPVHHLFYR